jgi:probable HAF family extracellular repeat protein
MRSLGNTEIVTALVVLATIGPGSPLRADRATFHGLGASFGWEKSQAYGVSSDGSVVVGLSGKSVVMGEAFRWTESEGMLGLGTGGFLGSVAEGVSADGSVVVGSMWRHEKAEGFRWTKSDGMGGLGELGGSSTFPYYYAQAVSSDGSIVVGYACVSTSGHPTNRHEAFRWQNGVMSSIGDLAGGYNSAAAYDISGDGSVIVGGGTSSSGDEAFRWENHQMIGLGDLPGGNTGSFAVGVSYHGDVVVGTSKSSLGTEAFLWEDGEMIRLGDLPGGKYHSRAWDVSADGSVVVGSGATPQGYEAFIWDPTNGMRNLREVLEDLGVNMSGWTLMAAEEISAEGSTVVGRGFNPEGYGEAWRAVLYTPKQVLLTLHVRPSDVGIDTVGPGLEQHFYPKNSIAVLRADSFLACPTLYGFDHWEGDVANPDSPVTSILMDSHKTVTAVYGLRKPKCGDECHPILQGDINGDCYVNLQDFALYSQRWLECTHPDCD